MGSNPLQSKSLSASVFRRTPELSIAPAEIVGNGLSMRITATVLIVLGLAATAIAADKSDLDDRIRALTVKFEEMQQKPDKAIPADKLKQALGIVLLDRTKAGFIFAYQGGGGVALVRNSVNANWSPAAFLTANEASLGFQVGGEQNFFVILLMTTNATRYLTEPKYDFAGEARGTAGNTTAGEQGVISSSGPPVLVYDDRSGLYGGAALKGGAIAPDNKANLTYYGTALTMSDILFNRQVQSTQATQDLVHQIDKYSKPRPKD